MFEHHFAALLRLMQARDLARDDRHGCVAMCKELFPQLDRELDAWEAEHGWLYC